MGFFNGVNHQTVSQASNGFSEFKVGDNHAYISKVEEKESKKGNPMLEITFTNDEGATIFYYIVEGEFKLSRLKQLYQAFGIPIGETNIQRWIGKWGIVVCKAGEPYDGKIYNKVSYVRPPDGAPQNQHRQQKPQQNQNASDDGFDDDIPF